MRQAPLSDFCRIIGGGRLKLSGKQFVEQGYPAYGAGGLNGYLAIREFEQPGVVLSSIGARCGKCFLAEGEWTSLANTQLIFPDPDKADIRFLWYQLDDEARWPRSGAAQPFIRPSDVKAHYVYLPPLEEQRRIVVVLDEAFAAIATATANAEVNLANAQRMLDAWLRRATQSAAGRNWRRARLGDLTTKVGSGATPRGGKESYSTEGTPLVRSLNVHDRRFKLEQLAYLNDDQAKQLANVTLRRHDVLLNITGASVARCCVLPDDLVGGRVNQHVSIIRTKAEALVPKFLEILLTSPMYKERLLGVGNQGGSTRQAITKAEIQDFEIELPPVEEQLRIVERAREIEDEVLLLARNSSRKVEALVALKQSLLHRAFSGELTEREPLAA